MNRALLGVLVVLASATVARGQAPARDNPSPARGSASIRGRVVDATGRPLSRVEIRAGGPGSQQANGLTDGQGRYELNDLPAGTYTVIATKANYVRTAWGEQRPEGPGKRIALADGQKLDSINLSLKRAGVIVGKIVDEFGDPVTDVSVSAMRYAYVQGNRRLMPGGRVGQTNDIGEFRVYGLAPGQYYISATLRNVMMNGANPDPGDRSGYAPTFYPGTGNLSEAQRLTVASGQTITGINLTLLPTALARVTGTALGQDGKPILNAMIVISPRGGVPGVMNNFVGPARPDGTFTIGGVAPGDYSTRLNVPTGESAEANLTVSGADVGGFELIAAKPSTIRGRIVFTDSATSAAPPKPTAIDLGAWRDWAFGQPVRSPAKIQDDGTFEISLAAGRVQVRAAPSGGTASTPAWRLNRVILGDLDVGDTGIEVPPNATVDNVIVEMTNHNSEVSGRVTDADGNLVRDVFVIVFAQDPVHWTVQTRYLSAVRPGVDDLYHARLLAGDYYAVAMSDVEPSAWTDSEFLTAARERAVRFSIADGEKKRIDLLVTPAPVF